MNSKFALKLGAILTALSLVKILYSYFINSPYEKDYSTVVNIIATIIFLAAEVVILVLAFRNYKKINIENRKLLTIGNGLKISTIAYLIKALIGNLIILAFVREKETISNIKTE